jgi:hypothetical protein
VRGVRVASSCRMCPRRFPWRESHHTRDRGSLLPPNSGILGRPCPAVASPPGPHPDRPSCRAGCSSSSTERPRRPRA